MTKHVVVLLLSVCFSLGQLVDEVKLDEFIAKMEEDAIELAQEVERLYTNRCNDFRECFRANYDHCHSELPSPICPAGQEFSIPACGNGEYCSGLLDLTTSTVRIPSDLADGDGNPTDPQVVETICFTRKLDEYFVSKRAADRAYWDAMGVEPRSMYFGSRTGVFRIFPGRQSEECGRYDPRVRPWYVAASSGPKNLIMILDTSGSMMGLRLELMKEAAKRVIATLAIGDRVAIVSFADMASGISDDGYVYIASEAAKGILIERIDQLGAKGGTNFLEAFNMAFDILDRSAAEEITVGCNTAILFLTDGEMTNPEGLTDEDVLEVVNERLDQTRSRIGKPIFLFTYSVSENDDVDVFPKQLACSQPYGVWSKVQADDDIVDSLSSYYFLFALGLGTDANQDFTAWVQPYQFITGDEKGTTVSVPVYDRTKEPHLFLGVVGVDFSLSAMDAAVGATDQSGADSKESFDRIILASTARCPRVELNQCEMESFRRRGAAGDRALCTSNCSATEFVQVEEEQCPAVSDYPRDLWANTYAQGLSYAERVCCQVGDTRTSSTCMESFSSKGSDAKVGKTVTAGLVASVAVLMIGLTVCCILRKRRIVGRNKPHRDPPVNPVHANGELTSSTQSLNLEVLKPTPTAPQAYYDARE